MNPNQKLDLIFLDNNDHPIYGIIFVLLSEIYNEQPQLVQTRIDDYRNSIEYSTL